MTKDVEIYFIDGCGRCSLGGTPQCKVHKWEKELSLLRNILQEYGLTEECKWGVPCYTYNGNNVMILSAFVDYCSINFFKGVLLNDVAGILSKPGENSQSARLLKFTNTKEIVKAETLIREYIFEAIEVEKAGLKVEFKQKDQLEYPDELLKAMEKNIVLQKAFEDLTPGRKRSYILHFNQTKNPKTRESRIDKCIPKIMSGKGFNEY